MLSRTEKSVHIVRKAHQYKQDSTTQGKSNSLSDIDLGYSELYKRNQICILTQQIH